MKFDIDTREMTALQKKIKRAHEKFGGKPVEDILLTGARTIRKAARKLAPKGKSSTSSRIESRSFGLVKERVTTTHKAGALRRAIVAKKLRTRRSRRGASSIIRKSLRTGGAGNTLSTVFAGRGFGKKGFFKAPHYHLVHDGTVERFHQSGKSVGRMTANPFFADAVDATQTQVLNQIEQQLDELFERGLRGEGVI